MREQEDDPMLSALIESLPPLHPLLELYVHDWDGVHFIEWASTVPGQLCWSVEHLTGFEERLCRLAKELAERRAAGRHARRGGLTVRDYQSRINQTRHRANEFRRSATEYVRALTADDMVMLRTHAPVSVLAFVADVQASISNQRTSR